MAAVLLEWISVPPGQTVSEPFKFAFKCNSAILGQLKHLF